MLQQRGAGRHRDVVDGSDAILVVHVNHNYVTADKKAVVKGSSVKKGSTFWQSGTPSFPHNILNLLSVFCFLRFSFFFLFVVRSVLPYSTVNYCECCGN